MESSENQNGENVGSGDKKPVGRPKKKIIYWSVNGQFSLGANQLKREVRNPVSGVVEEHSGLIGFHDHHYKTDNPAEIAIIEGCKSYKNGKVKKVTEDQFLRLLESVGTPGQVVDVATSPVGRI